MQNEQQPVGQRGELEGLVGVPGRADGEYCLESQAKDEPTEDKSPAECECHLCDRRQNPLTQKGFDQTRDGREDQGRGAGHVIDRREKNQKGRYPRNRGFQRQYAVKDRGPDRQYCSQQYR